VSPSELSASPSELLASPSELLASPSELSASPSELLASPRKRTVAAAVSVAAHTSTAAARCRARLASRCTRVGRERPGLGPLQTLNSLSPHQSSFVVDTLTAGTRDNAKVWALPLVQRPVSIFPCPLRFAIAVSL
jgi:hypothetical protein